MDSISSLWRVARLMAYGSRRCTHLAELPSPSRPSLLRARLRIDRETACEPKGHLCLQNSSPRLHPLLAPSLSPPSSTTTASTSDKKIPPPSSSTTHAPSPPRQLINRKDGARIKHYTRASERRDGIEVYTCRLWVCSPSLSSIADSPSTNPILAQDGSLQLPFPFIPAHRSRQSMHIYHPS